MVQKRSRFTMSKSMTNKGVAPAAHVDDKKMEVVNQAKKHLLRPLIGTALYMGYQYFNNGVGFELMDYKRIGLLGGSMFTANLTGDMVLPHLLISKSKGIRELENMLVEPLITGTIFAGGSYFLNGDLYVKSDHIPRDFAEAAVTDLAAGFGEGFIHALV